MPRRTAWLTEDASVYRDSAQLRYRKRGDRQPVFSGPPLSVCPPLDQLKKGAKVRIHYDTKGAIVKVKLAPAKVEGG